MRNPLVRRFGAFQAGRISIDEFEAVVTSVVSGSWDYPGFEELYASNCKPNSRGEGPACYPYVPPSPGPTEAGYRLFSSNRINDPVPTGAIEIPFAMNVEQVLGQPEGILSGRIETRRALQYSGNPAIDVVVDTNAGSIGGCSRESGANCVRFIEAFDAEA